MTAGSEPGRHFETSHLTADLAGLTTRGGLMALVAQALQLGLGLLATVILARLLRPEDFGVVAMATSLAGFFLVFKDMGISLATVQHSSVDHARISALFWAGLATSLLLGLTLAALAFPFGWLYGDRRVTEITWLLAVAAALGGLSIQHRGLLQRQMRFSAMAAVDLASRGCAFVVAVALALFGFGYWSLVWMRVAAAAALALATWLACDWRPGRPARNADIGTMLGFGALLTASSVADYVARNLDKVVVGRSVGERPLGFYSRAYTLLLVPLEHLTLPFNAVAIPALSRLADNEERYRRYFREGLTLLAMLGMPVVVFAFVATEPLVRVLLGAQWDPVVPLVRILAPGAFVETFSAAGVWACVSLGRGARAFRVALLNAIVLAIAFLVGVRWGAAGVAVGFSAATLAVRPAATAYCLRQTPVRVRDVLAALWRPALASLLAGAAILAWTRASEPGPHTSAPTRLAGLALAFGIAYLLAWALPPGGLGVLLRWVRRR